jgi:hypothetical protein
MGCAAMAQESGGLSPKAGAESDGLYTNVYFSFNFKLPEKWNVTWVAQDGPCGKECMLLDVRHPKYPKPMQMIQVTAEAMNAQATLREASAGATLVSMGAKKTSEPREFLVNGLTFYRTDYRSQLASSDLFQSMVVMPGKDYAAVFTFAAGSRRDLDDMLADFGKEFSKTGVRQVQQ